ncbi:T9SS type A sorting domain-containing protein [Chryseobacterium kwangjuense]|uniref:T9SS type A sorting domain-containing protein n=1 Tax=Chryseobacterium kwangjuense TaxID=267125 RepID=A0ABW9JYY8_9FLAO
MKKKLLIGAVMAVSVQITAQTVLLNETFETVDNNTNLAVGWSSEDRDGDGVSWMTIDDSNVSNPIGFSEKVAGSISPAATVDNLLISPPVSLSAGSISTLTYLAGSFTGSGNFPGNPHYAVYVLPAASTFMGTETPVLEETITTNDQAISKSVNLSAFAGQSVKIYFRNFNSPALYFLLDNVKITQGTLKILESNYNVQIGIYPNPATDFIMIKSKSKVIKATVYDSAGRKTSVRYDQNRVDVKTISPGVYTVRFETEDGKMTGKFIKK